MDYLAEIKRIKARLDVIGSQIKYEEWVFQDELKERIKLNLTGKEALDHYNRWMIGAGLIHLVIEEIKDK